jgi:4-diphosphocytidyl-2-C-methyl-D-erythritol kinase
MNEVSSSTPSLKVRSYAKINWTLDVLYKRDDGFHEIRTIYQTVSLYDRLLVSETDGPIEIICDDPRVPVDETNLAHRAGVRLRQATDANSGARIEIEKRIPVAAGLGGGSSNAAAALVALKKLWRIEITERSLLRIAASLGSDVPFFLTGGTALGIGRGEEVYPIQEATSDHLLLVNPGFAVSTAETYGRLTRPREARIMPFTLFAARAIRELPLAATNDLEEIVSAAHPEIAEVKRRLMSLGARRALLSGSGATLFAVFDNDETISHALAEMRASGYWVKAASAINRQKFWDTVFE